MTLYMYAAYIALSLAITVWVGNSLHKNGRIFHITISVVTCRSPIR